MLEQKYQSIYFFWVLRVLEINFIKSLIISKSSNFILLKKTYDNILRSFFIKLDSQRFVFIVKYLNKYKYFLLS